MPDALIDKDLPGPRTVDFAEIPTERLAVMREAGLEAVECHRVLALTGDNIVGEVIRGVETFYEWDHYPAGDVYDHTTHSQFYYHAHPQEERTGEHGHFHTFLRPDGMPEGIRPALVEDFRMPEGENDALSHLIAISMDRYGVPIRLFTTNRWVTGEVWYAADDVRAMLDCFLVDHAQPSWPVNRWITAMVRLFRPQIVALLEARDAAVDAWAQRHPGRNVLEDHALEITSALDIDIDAQVAAVSEALDGRRVS